MKKLFLSLLLVLPLLMPQSVMAKENAIASMDIKCTIDAQGTGTFTETWDMNVSSGTEVYKTFNQMEEKKLSIISVIRLIKILGTGTSMPQDRKRLINAESMKRTAVMNYVSE